MAFAHSPKIVTDGLVLALDAGNPKSYASGSTIWRDKSGNGYDGTLTNGPTFNAGNGGSILFDASDDYINLGNNAAWNSFGNSISIEVWFKSLGNISDFPRLVAKQLSGTTTAQSCFQLGIRSTGTFRFAVGTENGVSDVESNVDVNLNEIYHFVGSYDGSNLRQFVNGELVFTTAHTGTILTSDEPLTLGLSYYSGSDQYEFYGNIYQCRVYDRGITQQEAEQNYNALKGRFGL